MVLSLQMILIVKPVLGLLALNIFSHSLKSRKNCVLASGALLAVRRPTVDDVVLSETVNGLYYIVLTYYSSTFEAAEVQ